MMQALLKITYHGVGFFTILGAAAFILNFIKKDKGTTRWNLIAFYGSRILGFPAVVFFVTGVVMHEVMFTEVPLVVHQKVQEAEQALSSSHLTMEYSFRPDLSDLEFIVTEQEPAAGTIVRRGTAVTVIAREPTLEQDVSEEAPAKEEDPDSNTVSSDPSSDAPAPASAQRPAAAQNPAPAAVQTPTAVQSPAQTPAPTPAQPSAPASTPAKDPSVGSQLKDENNFGAGMNSEDDGPGEAQVWEPGATHDPSQDVINGPIPEPDW